MKNITIFGAGRSATALIQYALDSALERNWTVTVADADLQLATQKTGGHPCATAAGLDALDAIQRQELVRRSDVVISLLPPDLHLLLAQDCLNFGRHLVNASYLTRELREMDQEAREKGLSFMGEMGLDPGIDHMSAMEKIHQIREEGGKLLGFRSYAGGLIAPESDDNPWHYKFTWNPRNVVLAGQGGTAQYRQNGKTRFLPYNRLFGQYQTIQVEGMGEYEVYANRDSLPYCELYDLHGIPNLLRGTIRSRGFCEGWDALVRIGLTDQTCTLHPADNWTYKSLLEAYVGGPSSRPIRERTADFLGLDPDAQPIRQIDWLGLFDEVPVPLSKPFSPALALEALLLEKWALNPQDKDMIIMQHEFEYILDGAHHRLTSSLVMKGEDQTQTAMAKLVGLPLGIFAKLLLEGKVQAPGVNIPVMPEVYVPVLEELASFGVVFHDKTEVLQSA